MVLPAEVDSVHVHAAIISPVVGQGHNEFHVGLGRGVHYLVEWLHVNSWLAILPKLEYDLRRAGALATVLRETLGVVSGVLVVEAPGAENLEAGVLGSGEALFDIVLVLLEMSVRTVEISAYKRGEVTHVIEGEVVGIGSSVIKVLVIKLELPVFDSHKALRSVRLAVVARSSQGPTGEEAKGNERLSREHHRERLRAIRERLGCTTK